jgi:ankyrin repeat protein
MIQLYVGWLLMFAPLVGHASDEALNRRLRDYARLGRLTQLEAVVREGADVNGRAEFGETALFYAVQFSHIPAAKRLLRLGADPNVEDELGRSPLLKASENCNDVAAEELLRAGADVNHVDIRGRTPLIYAAEAGCARVVALLFSKRPGEVNFDAQDHTRRSAADYASHPWIEEMLSLARDRLKVQPELLPTPGRR